MPKPAARLLVATGAAALLLGGCGAQTPAPPAYSVDVVCQQGLPFARAYDDVANRYDPQVDSAHRRLQAARSVEDTRAALAELARVLDEYDGALSGLKAPDAETARLLAAAVTAGAAMAREARRIGAAGDPGAASQEQWPAITAKRGQTSRDLALKAAFFDAECG